MHTLLQMQDIARREVTRGLEALTDEDSLRRVEPMNCISWTIGHVAHQQHAFFVAWPQGKESDPQYRSFGTGSPASQPPLSEVMALWRASCDDADAWLDTATEESLREPFPSHEGENIGTLLARNIFHTWSHLGEISAIRQILGHRPPEFVSLHGWSYGGF